MTFNYVALFYHNTREDLSPKISEFLGEREVLDGVIVYRATVCSYRKLVYYCTPQNNCCLARDSTSILFLFIFVLCMCEYIFSCHTHIFQVDGKQGNTWLPFNCFNWALTNFHGDCTKTFCVQLWESLCTVRVKQRILRAGWRFLAITGSPPNLILVGGQAGGRR